MRNSNSISSGQLSEKLGFICTRKAQFWKVSVKLVSQTLTRHSTADQRLVFQNIIVLDIISSTHGWNSPFYFEFGIQFKN